MAGSSISTALAISVAATSASAADRAKTVTASAMPKDRLRPSMPLVATPLIGAAAGMRIDPSTVAVCSTLTRPIEIVSFGDRWKAMSPPSLT